MDFYDMDGQPISLHQYGELLTDEGYGRIGHDIIDGTVISTIWTGLNQNPGMTPPLIFETLTFGGPEEICERYATEAEALAGHRRICEEVRNAD